MNRIFSFNFQKNSSTRSFYNKIITKSYYSTLICESIFKNQIQQNSICASVYNSVHFKINYFNFLNKFEYILIQYAKMSSINDSSSIDIASGGDKVVVESDVSTKTVRNVQTQHGDFRTVDEENIVLVRQCIWTEGQTDEGETSATITTEEEPEQVVWIEPFSEVSNMSNDRLLRKFYFHLKQPSRKIEQFFWYFSFVFFATREFLDGFSLCFYYTHIKNDRKRASMISQAKTLFKYFDMGKKRRNFSIIA